MNYRSNLIFTPIKTLRKHLTITITTLFIICSLVFTYKFFFATTKKVIGNELKLVEITILKKSYIEHSIRVLGTIRPKHTTILIAKSSGTFDALAVTGQYIKKGELIAKIDNPDTENTLSLSQATEKIAESQYKRFDALLKTGYVSSKEVEEKKNAWLEAQKELSKTKINVDTMRFYAPFDGIIGAFKKREGAQINQGDAVVTIYDPANLIVDFDVPCTNIPMVREGQIVRIKNKNYPLSHIQRMIDDESHMCPADVAITCKNCLIGSSVNLDLVLQEKRDVIVVPINAIFLRNGKKFVYIVENDVISLTAVKTGIEEKSQVEIISGLKPGQQLVTKGQDRLYPKMRVKIYQPPQTIEH